MPISIPNNNYQQISIWQRTNKSERAETTGYDMRMKEILGLYARPSKDDKLKGYSGHDVDRINIKATY